MHKTFLEDVLDDLKENHIDPVSCVYILPSKRSGFFLKQYLSKRLDKIVFAPQILSIEEFVQNVSGLQKSNTIELTIQLYKAYIATAPKEPDDFSSFLKWGHTLLQDFNEIDRYLIPSHEILNYLAAIKEIDHWSLKKDPTEMVSNYLSLWSSLQNIYNEYTSRLLKKKMAYQGLMYKQAYENISEYALQNATSTFVFVGLNALNTAESNIIQHLLENNSCEVYWDIDRSFLEDSIHDAGLFIRKYLKEWPYYHKHKPKGVHNSFLQPKKIEITGVPKSISQAKYVGNVLENIAAEKALDLNGTAVVLADETLLTPVLNALPQVIQEANITMGLPLSNLVFHSFIESYIDMIDSKSNQGWFYKNVLKLLSNPYCQKIAAQQSFDFAHKINKDILSNNLLTVTERYLERYSGLDNSFQALFPKGKPTAKKIVKNILFLIEHLKKIFQVEKQALELEYLYHFYKVFNQLRSHLEAVDFIADIKSVKSLYKMLSSSENLDLIGQPLEGIQIMGMLESRNLDYDTVILTSVNEGILPTGKTNNSFIPYDVKKEYGLPTYKEKDAIYVYHFYRLIQRAKRVHLIYNTEPDVLEGGEKSRLISQLLTDERTAPYITERIAFPKLTIAKETPEQILKTPLLLSEIQSFANKGFSPTSLTNYIANPLNFYKQSILRLQDPMMVEESIAPNTLGTILHDTLYTLYSPLKGKLLADTDIESLKSRVDEVVTKLFRAQLPGADTSKGRYLLVFHVIKKYINNFLALEKEQCKSNSVKIIALEERYEVVLDLPELNFPVRIKGIIDRIEECNGMVRVIDYKTGNTAPSDVKFKMLEEVFTKENKAKAFQLLCYSYLLNKTQKQKRISTGIYALKNLSNGLLPLAHNNTITITEELLNEFEIGLKNLVLEICNPEVPFLDKTE